MATKTSNLQKYNKLTHPIYDQLFNKIKQALGMDALRALICGSAPINKNVMNFFRIMLSVPVCEGYGQTEGCGVASIAAIEDMNTYEHVGGPTPCNEIVLFDVPEMGYNSTDTEHGSSGGGKNRGIRCMGRGEICIRGPNVFKGYYRNSEKTNEVLDSDGWLHSGDIGLWNVSGTLKIIDRKKNIFKLAQGEYVAPEKIENILINSLYISQCYIHGDSLQSSLVAIVVPDEEYIMNNWYSNQENKPLHSKVLPLFKDLCQNQALKDAIMLDIKKLSKLNGLHGFEIVKAVHLEPEQFTPENGFLTPTLKLKRQQLRDYYDKQISDLYVEISNNFANKKSIVNTDSKL